MIFSSKKNKALDDAKKLKEENKSLKARNLDLLDELGKHKLRQFKTGLYSCKEFYESRSEKFCDLFDKFIKLHAENLQLKAQLQNRDEVSQVDVQAELSQKMTEALKCVRCKSASGYIGKGLCEECRKPPCECDMCKALFGK